MLTDKIRQEALLARRGKSKEYSANVIPMIQEHLGTGHSLNTTARISPSRGWLRSEAGNGLQNR